MSAWMLHVVWPIENPALFDQEAIALAREDLGEVAARTGAVVTGEPKFRVVDTGPERGWPYTSTAVVCDVPAVPAATRSIHPPITTRRVA